MELGDDCGSRETRSGAERRLIALDLDGRQLRMQQKRGWGR